MPMMAMVVSSSSVSCHDACRTSRPNAARFAPTSSRVSRPVRSRAAIRRNSRLRQETRSSAVAAFGASRLLLAASTARESMGRASSRRVSDRLAASTETSEWASAASATAASSAPGAASLRRARATRTAAGAALRSARLSSSVGSGVASPRVATTLRLLRRVKARSLRGCPACALVSLNSIRSSAISMATRHESSN